MPYTPKDGRPTAPDAPKLSVPATDRKMLRGTFVRPAKMPASIGPTYKGPGNMTYSSNVPGAEIIPMDTPRILAMFPLRHNELLMERARAKERESADWEAERIENEPGYIPYPLRFLRASAKYW